MLQYCHPHPRAAVLRGPRRSDLFLGSGHVDNLSPPSWYHHTTPLFSILYELPNLQLLCFHVYTTMPGGGCFLSISQNSATLLPLFTPRVLPISFAINGFLTLFKNIRVGVLCLYLLTSLLPSLPPHTTPAHPPASQFLSIRAHRPGSLPAECPACLLPASPAPRSEDGPDARERIPRS